MSEKIKPDDVIKWVAILGGLYLIYKVTQPVDKIITAGSNALSFIGDILNAPKKAIDIMRDAAKNPNKPVPATIPTTTPGLSTQDLGKIIDKRMMAAVDGADLRKLGKSSSSIIQQFNRYQFVGYVYSVINEKLATGDKTWIAVSNSPGGTVIGYMPLRVALFDSITIPRILKNDQLSSGSIGYLPRMTLSYIN